MKGKPKGGMIRFLQKKKLGCYIKDQKVEYHSQRAGKDVEITKIMS